MSPFRWLMSVLVAVIFAVAGVTVPSATSSPVLADRRPTPPPIGLPSPSPIPNITVLAVGDSLTVGHGPGGTITPSYRTELSRLMHMTGQAHTWRVEALGGTKCADWAVLIDAIITAHAPAILFLNCGTNDIPAEGTTEAAYRTILTRAAARGVQVVASLIGAPDMRSPTNISRPWIDDWHAATNAAILRALVAFPQVRWADMRRVPGDPEWLYDGIHLNARAEAAWGQLFYQAAQPTRLGWLTLAAMGQQEMCGLHGNPGPSEPWPTPDVAYVVCRYS